MKNIKRNKEYEPEILQKLHTLQLEMLSDLQKICENCGSAGCKFAEYGSANRKSAECRSGNGSCKTGFSGALRGGGGKYAGPDYGNPCPRLRPQIPLLL